MHDTPNFYGRWTGDVTDPETGEPHETTITSPVIDGELRGHPATRATLARWAVWLATPDALKHSPDCDITADDPPVTVEIISTNHPAHHAADTLLDAVAEALPPQAPACR